MRFQLPHSRVRLWLLFGAAGLVLIHAVGVLIHVQATPDIGLRCAFRTVFISVNPDRVIAEEGVPPEARPARGDTVLALAGRETPTWVHFLRALREEIAKEDTGDRADTTTRRRRGGETELLVHYRKGAGEFAGQEFKSWCRLDTPDLREVIPSTLWLVLKLSLFLVGAFVFWKRPEDRSATLFFWFCILAVGAYMGGYHWARILSQPALLLVFMVCAVFLPVVSLHFFLVFPRPKEFFRRRPRWVLAAMYGPPLGFLAAMFGYYFRLRDLWELQAAAGVIKATLWDFRTVIYLYLGVAAVWYTVGVAALVHSFRRAQDATERNQVKWILTGAAVALAPIAYTLCLAVWWPQDFGSGGATWPMFAASAFVTAAFGVSITRYRLMQLDQFLSSGVLYFLISTFAGAAFYAFVLLGMLVVGSQVADGPSVYHALGAGVTVLVLLIVLDVVRGRVMRELDRRLHKDRYQLEKTLRRMGQTIEQLVDPPTLARRLLQASAELLGVSRGAVYLRTGEPPLYRLVDSLGQAPVLTELPLGCPLIEKLEAGGVLAASARPEPADFAAQRQLGLLGGHVARGLVQDGRLLAVLLLGPKEPGPYTAEDLTVLGEFAQMTALALASAERHQTIEALNRDLRDKVAQLAEQQRRILALQSQLKTVAGGAGGQEARGQACETAARAAAPPADAPGIVGSSLVMRELFQLVRKVSASESAVLLRGESGTGKELLARALHEQSPRSAQAFVKVHCAALSPGLLESELFGHVKGAFTGAHRDKIGRFELADGGTLFLDEIGDINLDVQTKLLRVLQEMTFERVGSSEPVEVNVRVIAATHQDLEGLIRKGKFREDLYYRLNVISLLVPPLRDRREDIPELALHFLQLYAQRGAKNISQIDDDAMAVLKGHAWPGNIRQLENVIERAVVVADGPWITVKDLPSEVVETAEAEADSEAWLRLEAKESADDEAGGIRAERDRWERDRIIRAMTAARGNKAEAARALGLARSTLVSRLKKYGLG